ncbi:right-handed parallel beta-helix repeat-containing protein [Larkinella terrae]|uniref:Right-handed parallel beta-helix repeat-containing protein n=1 Tax=Larkinella terrae TaxID=2025311 RepID=A0A7K0EVA0_9BACT|nr:right-handed parallel beta-helix repeat-containing protein [Larkinella terrae]MRS65689.1 right-handed parallel beta-helix repeat-containing protein [Larkinella terrae]
MCNRFFLLSCLWLLATDAFSQTIYVAPSGNDQNPGTLQKPLATLTGARNRARLLRRQKPPIKPIEVVVRKGEYLLTEPLVLSAEDSGLETAPLVFRGEAGSTPVFYGGMRLKKFEKVSDELWKTDVPEVRRYGWLFEQLYVNGQRATRAQTPNNGFFQPKAVSETILNKGTGRLSDLAAQKVTVPIESMPWFSKLSEADLAKTVVTFYHNWDNTRKPVLSVSEADTAIYITGEGMKPWNKITSHSLFVIENLRAALDAPGEWFLEKTGTLYYRPRPGETIDKITGFAPVNEKFVVINGDEKAGRRASNIRFENLSFQIAGYQMPAFGVEPEQAAARVEATVQLDFADKISFINCEVAHTGGSGIWFRRACANGRVERCYLHDLGASGVKIGETVIRPDSSELTHHITVDNNIMRSGGHVFPCAVALIIFNGRDNVLSHNEIADFRYSGVSVGWVWGYAFSPSKRNRVEFNHIHHLGWGVLSDMGGVYTLGVSEGTVVSNNVIHHIYAFDYGGWGLYTDEGSTDIVMENNLVYACKSSGFHQHYGKDNLIRNNIFADNIKAQLQATRVEPHRSFLFTNNIIYYKTGTLLSSNWAKFNLLADQNCYWDPRSKNELMFGKQTVQEWQQSGKDQHSIIADPGFVNPEAFDFRLANTDVVQKIGFKPFDYSQAGVYGTIAWKNKARLDSAVAQEFDEMVAQHEKK